MIDSPMSLSPDDEPQTDICLHEEPDTPREPYAITAFLFALVVMLVVYGISHYNRIMTLTLGAVDFLFAYLALVLMRPPLPHLILTIIAAEVGMFCNLPDFEIYSTAWQTPEGNKLIIRRILFAGIAGLLFAIGLDVRRNPPLVIAISFFSLFVVTGQYYITGIVFP